MKTIYLDYNATTPMDPRVLKAMEPYFFEKFGNEASHAHAYGWEAHEAVKMARASIARIINARDPKNIIFTSGATESNNLALKGIARGAKKSTHIITQKTEHQCVLETCKELEHAGHEVTILGVDDEGFVNPALVQKSIRSNTVLCSIMMANNEIGTLEPVQEIAKICHQKGVLFHSDAVQAVGKIPLDVQELGIDLLSLSAHKIYGPKGSGALYIGDLSPSQMMPLFQGGGHERGLRSGTLNVPGIVGLAKALELCHEEQNAESKRLISLRDHLIKKLVDEVEFCHLNGPRTNRLPNNVNISFDFIASDDLITKVPQLAFSSGSACSSGKPEPSYVISAITDDKNRIAGAIRMGIGRQTTTEEIDEAIRVIVKAVGEMRAQSVAYEMFLAENTKQKKL